MLLESPHCLVESVVEQLESYMSASGQVFVEIVQHPQRGQRSPDVGDSGATVADAQRIAVFAARTRHTKGPPGETDFADKCSTANRYCRRSSPISGKPQGDGGRDAPNMTGVR